MSAPTTFQDFTALIIRKRVAEQEAKGIRKIEFTYYFEEGSRRYDQKEHQAFASYRVLVVLGKQYKCIVKRKWRSNVVKVVVFKRRFLC